MQIPPRPGMMPFEDVAIQLIDLPPLSEEHVEHWVYDTIRRADLLWLVVEHSSSMHRLETTGPSSRPTAKRMQPSR